MRVCRVVGTVVAPVKSPKLDGQKLLLCQPVDLDDKPIEESFVAIDRVQAGEGDLVLTQQEGGGARIVLGDQSSPVQRMVIAVVDGFDVPKAVRQFDPPVRWIDAEVKR